MEKENTTEQNLEQLRASYIMYEDTINELKKIKIIKPNVDNDKIMDLTLKAMKGVEDDYYYYGGTKEELKAPREKKHKRTDIKKLNTILSERDDIKNNKETPLIKKVKPKTTKEKINNNIEYFNTINFNSDEPFDLVPIPSKGVCYQDKRDKLPVSYLTASDEDIITSPNLYTDNLILEYIIKSKVKIPNFNPNSLLPGDRDALLLWLRITGYGPEYPVTVKDPISKTTFDTVINLTDIKQKEIKINADENGYFDFKLPLLKDNIKFKYLTIEDRKYIDNESLLTDEGLRKNKLLNIINDIQQILENDANGDANVRGNVLTSVDYLNEWVESFEVDELKISNNITTSLINHIYSVNGETDKSFIEKYVKKMPSKDSLDLRRYIKDNEPGLDFSINVVRPESLGGGSVPMFLTLDDTLFLNVL